MTDREKGYFESYSHFGIHEEMIKDKVRTDAYKNAIIRNKHLFANKTVLDVGCGTGILSMFCAKAGAKKVVGIEYSNIANNAKAIVRDNKLDHIITIIKGKVEEVELPVSKVDIIVSEWMGYCLFYESMLDTVVFARNKWLAPGGILLPDKAHMYVCGIEDFQYTEEKINWWNNVYGFNMESIRQVAINEPLVDCVEARSIVTNRYKFLSVDLNTVQISHLKNLRGEFILTATRNDYIHALVLYFVVDFSVCHSPISISTGPGDTYTHWKQTVLYLSSPLCICNGESIEASLSLAKNLQNERELDICLDFDFSGSHDKRKEQRTFYMK